jgi:hypothetical protein
VTRYLQQAPAAATSSSNPQEVVAAALVRAAVAAEVETAGAGSSSTGSEPGRSFAEVAGVDAAVPAAVGRTVVDSRAGSIAAEVAGSEAPAGAAAVAAAVSEPGTDIGVGEAVEQVGRWHGSRTRSAARTGHGLWAVHWDYIQSPSSPEVRTEAAVPRGCTLLARAAVTTRIAADVGR